MFTHGFPDVSQHVPLTQLPVVQLHVCALPQLSTMLPQLLPVHGSLATQHAPASHVPFVQLHDTAWPHESVTLPQLLPVHGLPAWHTQLVPWHVVPAGQLDGHVTGVPQPLSTLVWQRPLHTFVAGVQHAPPSSHVAPLAHAVVPPAPQLTAWPHESIAVPHCLPAQALPTGTHPHVFDVHVAPPSQVPQSTVRPQLSVVEAHRPSHQ